MFAMIPMIKDFFRKKAEKKILTVFSEETKANLEGYYVMFQLNRLRFFPLSAWDSVKDRTWPEAVCEYVRRLSSYNQVLQDYKNYEQWYNEDLDRKNQDNGRLLHQKKELTQEQFKGLEDVIKTAAAQIEELC